MLRLALLPAAMAAIISAGSPYSSAMAAARPTSGEINAALHAQTSLAQAVTAAEQAAGGRAASVAVIRDHHEYQYKVTVVANGKVMDEYVALESGKIVRGSDRGSIDHAFGAKRRQAYDKMTTSPTTLLGAIAAAEKEYGGTAVAARLENRSAIPRVHVDLAKKDKAGWRESAVVDLSSGKVVALPVNTPHSKR